MCGSHEAIDLFLELTALADSIYISGTYPDSVTRCLRQGLRRDCELALSHPRNANFYNQLYSARVRAFSTKQFLDGIQNKHPVIRWLTLRAFEKYQPPQDINWNEILKSVSNDVSEVVRNTAIKMREAL
jgi:hypothetical protein